MNLEVIAYVDPTSGGILLQLLLGGSAAYLVVWRLLRHKARRLFHRKPNDEQ